MPPKVCSKRHRDELKDLSLSQTMRQRAWFLMQDCDPCYDPDSGFNEWSLAWRVLGDRLKREHGWDELRAYTSQGQWRRLDNVEEFVLAGVPRFVLDATELFHDLLVEHNRNGGQPPGDPHAFQRGLNVIFEDANLPWRMLEGRITRVDSRWLEAEIHSKVAELLSLQGFDGALAEFQQARSALSAGDCKAAISAANLAFESTLKAILGIEQAKPGELVRAVVDSGLIPDYYEGFLKAFEEHILRSVAVLRNFEKGVGHGQGVKVNDPPRSLADLGVNLAGVLILYLLKRHLEVHPTEQPKGSEPSTKDDDFPF